MIGGGPGAFIGGVHRIAAAIDQQIELVCGSFSSDPVKTKETGKELYLDPKRCYDTYEQMFQEELKLPEGERMDIVSIVTPNFLHFKPAKLALESGFHVIMDKPVTFNTQEALDLEKVISKSGKLFALTHTYTGYPMVKQARELIEKGVFGKIRKVVVEYPQGWLSTPLEQTDSKQAGWRTDPSKSGKGGAVGDIGTHAGNLVETILGKQITEVAADVSSFVDGRKLDDDLNVLIRLENGAKGVMHCSQICAGDENDVNIRIWGEKGGLEWHQHDPNTMKVKWLDKPTEVYRTGNDYMGEMAQAHTRTPFGHPEGYLEAFANIYRNFAKCVQAEIIGAKPDPANTDFPGIKAGIRGMKLIDAVVKSGENNTQWTKID